MKHSRSYPVWSTSVPLVALSALSFLGCGDDNLPARDMQTMDSGALVGPKTCTVLDGGAARGDAGAAQAEVGSPCGEGQNCVGGLCLPNVCGDGVTAGREECDDGNQLVADGCTPSCESAPLTCGDGSLQDGEECDDGNLYDHDKCSNDCTFNKCGNGREDGLEECDDKNSVDDDRCSNTCTENRCLNGRLDPGEECDDGNQTNDDGTWVYADGTRNNRDVCSNTCQLLECGNGRVEGELFGGSEQCDDGNDAPFDGCSNGCEGTGCGNGILEPGELCEGVTARHVCNGACQEMVEDEVCDDCRQMHCRDYNALDVFAGCFLKELPSPDGGVATLDETFIKLCEDLVTCMRVSGNGYSGAGSLASYCGDADIGSTCSMPGGANGPCMAEWEAAIGSKVPNDILGAAGDDTKPAGAAHYVIECDAKWCLSQCGPRVY